MDKQKNEKVTDNAKNRNLRTSQFTASACGNKEKSKKKTKKTICSEDMV